MFFSLIFYINYCKRAFSSVSHNFSSFGDYNLPEFLNGVTIRQTKNIWDLKKCSITREDLYENTLQVIYGYVPKHVMKSVNQVLL